MTKTFDQSGKWVTVCIYYEPPFEKLLSTAVSGFIEGHQHLGLFDSFFFVRYWQKGYHIRLRLRSLHPNANTTIVSSLQKHLTRHLDQHPSIRLKDSPLLYPNNSLRFIQYEPEIARYGGEDCVMLSEKQFMHSSEFVLGLIKSNDTWDYEKAMSFAIISHLSFVKAFDLSASQASIFFSLVSRYWMPRAFDSAAHVPETDPAFEKLKEKTINKFQVAFNHQKTQVTKVSKTLWKMLDRRQSTGNKVVDKWFEDSLEMAKSLRGLQRERKLFPPDWFPNESDIPEEMFDCWKIMHSYIHMTNNRIGIQNRDEAYIAFVICQVLSK